MSKTVSPPAPAIQDPLKLVDDISGEEDEAIALLDMLRVFCQIEQREATTPALIDVTLSDAAPGLAVLMGDLSDRVQSIKDKAELLYQLPADAAGGAR